MQYYIIFFSQYEGNIEWKENIGMKNIFNILKDKLR
jgi:hypothetical protein